MFATGALRWSSLVRTASTRRGAEQSNARCEAIAQGGRGIARPAGRAGGCCQSCLRWGRSRKHAPQHPRSSTSRRASPRAQAPPCCYGAADRRLPSTKGQSALSACFWPPPKTLAISCRRATFLFLCAKGLSTIHSVSSAVARAVSIDQIHKCSLPPSASRPHGVQGIRRCPPFARPPVKRGDSPQAGADRFSSILPRSAASCPERSAMRATSSAQHSRTILSRPYWVTRHTHRNLGMGQRAGCRAFHGRLDHRRCPHHTHRVTRSSRGSEETRSSEALQMMACSA